jgi:hypothetical protein
VANTLDLHRNGPQASINWLDAGFGDLPGPTPEKSARPIRLSFAAPRRNRCKPARNSLRFCNLGLQPAAGCQGYPTTRWADATVPSAVANCIRYRNTIVPGRVPSPTTVPCAWQVRAIQPLRMCGKAPFPFRDWQRRALSRQ